MEKDKEFNSWNNADRQDAAVDRQNKARTGSSPDTLLTQADSPNVPRPIAFTSRFIGRLIKLEQATDNPILKSLLCVAVQQARAYNRLGSVREREAAWPYILLTQRPRAGI